MSQGQNLSIKAKYFDHINGFALAFLAALPVIRTDIIAAPVFVLLLPALIMFSVSVVKLITQKKLLFFKNVLLQYYLILSLFLFLLISIFWRSFDFGITQDIASMLFILITVTAVLLSFNIKSISYFLNWVIAFAVFATLLLIYQYIQVGNLRGYGISGYLTKAQLIGAGALIAFYKLLYFKSTNNKLYSFYVLLLFVGLALSLARGALLSAVLIAIGMAIFYFKTNKVKSYSIIEWFSNMSVRIASVGLVGILIVLAMQIERTALRLQRLFTGGEIAGPRSELWSNSVTGISEAPFFGYGVGSSGIISSGQATYYPHNLFLQVSIDGGIVALIILTIVCLYPIFRTVSLYISKKLKSHLWIPLFACYIFMFMEYSKSMNFYDARIFISIGLILVITVEYIANKKSIK